MELDFSEIDVKALLERSLIMITEKSARSGIGLCLDIPAEMEGRKIKADAKKLKQVLVNLLSNALKFTPTDGRISVGAEMKKNELIIYVKDTGIGIKPEDHEKVFNEFYQVKNRIVDDSAGTGLGLSLCKRLVELHGGKIWIESKGYNRGSCFFFSIPIEDRA